MLQSNGWPVKLRIQRSVFIKLCSDLPCFVRAQDCLFTLIEVLHPGNCMGILNLKKKYIVGRLQAVSPFRRNPLRKSKQRNWQKKLTWRVKHLHRKCYTHARHITVLSHVVLMRLTCVSDCCQQTNRHWCGQVRLFFTRLSLLRNQQQFWS